MDQQITMQFKAIGLRLPVKRRFSYSQVTQINRFSRQAWWSHGILGKVTSINPLHIYETISAMYDSERTPMPLRGFRYYIVVIIRGGKAIRLGPVNSLDVAKEIEQQCQQRFGFTRA